MTKPSEHTQRVYRTDIINFLRDLDLSLGKFLTCDRYQAFELVSRYMGQMSTKNLSPSTINRRISAIKSLVTYAYNCGKCEYVLDNVKSLAIEPYRDTSGVSLAQFKQILAAIDETSLKGKRDRAILLLLWGNALRRSELAGCNIADFDPDSKTLRIKGKGRSQHEIVSLGTSARAAIQYWLIARGEINPTSALFCSVNPGYKDGRLCTQAIADIVISRSKAAGVNKKMSPHRIRHSSITAALDATNGNVREVQKLSRHKNVQTLLVYDDNRTNAQAKVTNILDGLI
ncbi:tyrosine-type recombinase/integrase [Merismopedia glauca]|uniref:tyrosine-type recombinase/integrase n=1 Tax=Merismopedia glauca TaxID=292586 RepID=UPI0030D96570